MYAGADSLWLRRLQKRGEMGFPPSAITMPRMTIAKVASGESN